MVKDINILKSNNVEVDAALEFWGDIDSYNDALLEFKDSLNEKLESLEYYKNESDWNNYGILAHSMKSEAKYLGFMKDAEVFLEHELKGKENDGSFINSNFNNLVSTAKKIQNLLERYFSGENSTKKKKILIADDSSIILNFIDKNISEDYQTIKVNNGKDALEMINSGDIYALLLDLNMPGLNGFQVLDFLKGKDLLEKMPVVVITGDDTEDTIKRAFTYPILDVLNKPFNEEKIRRVLVSINSFYEKK